MRRRTRRAGPVEAPCSVAPLGDEAGFAKLGEVLGDGRPRDVEVPCDVAGRQLAIADEGEDGPTTRVGQARRAAPITPIS